MYHGLHERFAATARAWPDRIAVRCGNDSVRYRDLDAMAENMARMLRGNGVRPRQLVGLSCERGVPLIGALLGILRVGAGYLPLDPGFPPSRLEFLVRDSGVRIVLADAAGAESVRGVPGQVVELPAEPNTTASADSADWPAAGPDDIAYVIYTSGSTGTPKGVEVSHGNVTRLFDSTADWFGFDEQDVWTLFHSPSFDFSVWEIWGALLHGGTLVVVPADTVGSPMRLATLLAEERVTVLNQTPSAFRLLASLGRQFTDRDLALRTVIFGGERLDVALLGDWIAEHGDEYPRLINMYGITETTVHVTFRRIHAADLGRPGRSPIGVPIPDLAVSLRDQAGRPVPDGTPGEIWVSGAGVARGYLNRPELTAQRFVRADGVRWYRSGDLGVLDGAELVHYGRMDDQIKVRGFRIEPFEVEAALLDHPEVAEAVVDSHDFGDGDVRLVACIQPADGSEPGAEGLDDRLRNHVAGRLPAHLRPSHYIVVPRIPLTLQGKVDRRALREQLQAVAAPVG